MTAYFDSRVDPVRSVVVGIGAILALLAAWLDANDLSMSFQNIVVPFLLVVGVVVAVLAILPATRPWSYRRRSVAVCVAIAIAIPVIIVLWLSPASGCACVPDLPPGWRPPEILGVQAPTGIFMAAIGDPLLLLIAASPLPDRFAARGSLG